MLMRGTGPLKDLRVRPRVYAHFKERSCYARQRCKRKMRDGDELWDGMVYEWWKQIADLKCMVYRFYK